MLDRWVQATLEWENVSRLGRLPAHQWDRMSPADQLPRDGWPAQYVGWTLAESVPQRPTRNGRTNRKQGAVR